MHHNVWDRLKGTILIENGKPRCFQSKRAAEAFVKVKNHEFKTGEWLRTIPRFKGDRFIIVPYKP